jgi:transposase
MTLDLRTAKIVRQRLDRTITWLVTFSLNSFIVYQEGLPFLLQAQAYPKMNQLEVGVNQRLVAGY